MKKKKSNQKLPTLGKDLCVNLLTLRDGQQSTLRNWNFRIKDWASLLYSANLMKYQHAEVAGGRSFHLAIKNGHNPFRVIEILNLAKKYTHKDINKINFNHSFSNSDKDIIQFQMLIRGVNGLGFRHYTPDVIESCIVEYIKVGITKFRFFDAFNDIDNIYIPDSIIKHKDVKNGRIILQGALSFTHYLDAPKRYSDEYYVNYARKLIIEKGMNSIAIKDMSSQLSSKRLSGLVKKLKRMLKSEKKITRDIPIDLHIHSTDEKRSLEAMQCAIDLNIGIETVEGPLSKGPSHHALEDVNLKLNKKGKTIFEKIVDYDEKKYQVLKAKHNQMFGKKKRLDANIPSEVLKKLCRVGIPGGAIPSVISDLQTYYLGIKKNNKDEIETQAKKKSIKIIDIPDKRINLDHGIFDIIIDLFIRELTKVCRDTNYPPLVTPTADIVTKQSIWNLQYGNDLVSGEIEERYGNEYQIDPRFVKMALGYYGQMKSYKNQNDKGYYQSSFKLIEFLEITFDSYELLTDHPYLKMIERHFKNPASGELMESYRRADKLIAKYRHRVLAFASRDQLALMIAMKPTAWKDPIERCLNLYLKRVEKFLIQQDYFEDFKMIIYPLLKQIDAFLIFGAYSNSPLNIKVESFGELGRYFFEVYQQFPAVNKIRMIIDDLKQSIRQKSLNKSIVNTIILKQKLNFIEAQFEKHYLSSVERFVKSDILSLAISLIKLNLLYKLFVQQVNNTSSRLTVANLKEKITQIENYTEVILSRALKNYIRRKGAQ